MTRSQRELCLSAAFALWGLAIAISLAAVWTRPAPPGQLPGLATRSNFDASGPFRWMAGMIVLPILLPLLLRPLTRRLADGRDWAFHAALFAPLAALWFVSITRAPSWVVLPVATVLAVCTLLRSHDLSFSRRDVVLVPTMLAVFLSVHDLANLPVDKELVIAGITVFLLRVGVALIPSPVEPALAFVAAPLGLLLQTSFFARDQRYLGWHALLIAIVTPPLVRVFLRNLRRGAAILAFITLPLALIGYFNATSLYTAEGKRAVNVFEDSHPLLPASEYLARELPYRDVVPAHGLIQDGLLDYLLMQVRGASIGATLGSRATLGLLNVVALYALAFALTGSGEAAFLAVMLAVLTNTHTLAFRFLPAIVSLALMCGAVRFRRLQWLRYAAIATVLCGATSVDLGAYALVALVVTVLRFPGDRVAALRAAAIGTAIAVVPLFGGLAALGILDDFFRTTFVELPSLGPVYTQTMFDAPAGMPTAFPEVLTGFLRSDTFLYLLWCAAAAGAGVLLARPRRRRLEAVTITSVWIVVAGLSYAERHHLYFAFAAAPLSITWTLLAARRHLTLALAMSGILLIAAAPTTHLGIVGWVRDARGPVEQGLVEVPEIPRARGGLFRDYDAAALRGVNKYVSLALAPDETWLDFSNRGIFYFLLRRDCPIRQAEVAFYETEARQRDVIARLERDPRIRAVLLPGPSGRYTVDGVPNQERAPLVWAYIQTHFEPDFEEGDVVIWRRK